MQNLREKWQAVSAVGRRLPDILLLRYHRWLSGLILLALVIAATYLMLSLFVARPKTAASVSSDNGAQLRIDLIDKLTAWREERNKRQNMDLPLDDREYFVRSVQ